MGLNFIGDVGVYLPSRDAVKITAIDGDRVIDCYATRSALEAVGCPGLADGSELIRHFQRHRDNLELAAIVKYRRALTRPTAIEVEAADLAAILPASAA